MHNATNYPWAQHWPDDYKGRQERTSAFLLASVFPGQGYIRTTVFHNKVRQVGPWQKCSVRSVRTHRVFISAQRLSNSQTEQKSLVHCATFQLRQRKYPRPDLETSLPLLKRKPINCWGQPKSATGFQSWSWTYILSHPQQYSECGKSMWVSVFPQTLCFTA